MDIYVAICPLTWPVALETTRSAAAVLVIQLSYVWYLFDFYASYDNCLSLSTKFVLKCKLFTISKYKLRFMLQEHGD